MLKLPSQPVEGDGWSVWDCDPSKFNWHYESKELAYLFKGRVKVRTREEMVEIKAGDFVTFPAGLSCSWEVLERVEKVYKFE
ncbi:MAG: cupin domain-containing protein [Candidatus Omnitrophica bacterium]|nr:cupin domain-containing protein [Candidatus Omnitrophota bacterium]